MKRHALVLAILLCPTPVLSLDLHFFRSPSDNIHCMAFKDEGQAVFTSVECEISDTSGPPVQPKPSDCDLEWGGRFIIRQTGRADLVCHGDTIRTEGSPILLYGGGLQFSGITCLVTEKGLEYRNVEGRGFFMSKARQVLF